MHRIFNLFGQKKIKTQLPIITISREMGSGGRPIAYVVAKKLGKPWKVFHKEIIDQIAKETELEKELIEEVEETHIPLIRQIIDRVFGTKYINLSDYYKHLVRILSTIGQRGHAIIIGRGANFLFPEALNIRIICEMEQRIKWLMKYEKITKKEAIKKIKDSDKKRVDFIQSLFNHDPRRAQYYDLIIRTSKYLSIDDAAEVIVTLAKRIFKL